MRGMYNSSMWDSTGGLTPKRTPSTNTQPLPSNTSPNVWGTIFLPRVSGWSVESVSSSGECEVTDGQEASDCSAGQLSNMTGRGEEDQIVVAAEQKRKTPGRAERKKKSPMSVRIESVHVKYTRVG